MENKGSLSFVFLARCKGVIGADVDVNSGAGSEVSTVHTHEDPETRVKSRVF